jgi:hypothetical protein
MDKYIQHFNSVMMDGFAVKHIKEQTLGLCLLAVAKSPKVSNSIYINTIVSTTSSFKDEAKFITKFYPENPNGYIKHILEKCNTTNDTLTLPQLEDNTIVYGIVKREILNLRDLFLQEGLYDILPKENTTVPNYSHINNGYCYGFAANLMEELLRYGITVYCCEEDYKGIPHGFIRVNDLYFDSECPNGVKNWKELPIYRSN